MHGINPIDPGRDIDWGKTSQDYARYRPGPPASFYQRLLAHGVGLPGQRILDLGTGTGVIARQMAQQGATVTGVDVSLEQIQAARALGLEQGLDVSYVSCPAEAAPFLDQSFDVLTANQCWLYFDKAVMVEQVKRMLRPEGVLVTSHNCWLPRQDPIARATEELVLEYNPAWTGADWPGIIPDSPNWARGKFSVKSMFYYDEPIRFTREGWRGRIRACRGVGAALSSDVVSNLDRDLEALLDRIAGPEFAILHRIDAHILVPSFP